MGQLFLAAALVGLLLPLVGALSHLLHFDTLVDQLSLHLAGRLARVRRERRATQLAAALVVGETVIPLAALTGWLIGSELLETMGVLATAALGLVFVGWLLQLLATGSDLPCACSTSSAPPTTWSIVRALPIVGAGLLPFGTPAADLSFSGGLTAFVGAGSVALALFILPDALQWPEFSRSALEGNRSPVQGALR